MDLEEANARVDEILAASQEWLTRNSELSIFPPQSFLDWKVPGIDPVGRLGLPPAVNDNLLRVTADFQLDSIPTLDDDLFGIARYGTARIGVRQSDGLVFSVSKYKEIHPQLRPLHPNWTPTVMIDSSIGAFVDCSWRWFWIIPILAEQQSIAGEEEIKAWSSASTAEEQNKLPDFHAGVVSLCEKVATWFEEADPGMPSVRDAFWRPVIMENL